MAKMQQPLTLPPHPLGYQLQDFVELSQNELARIKDDFPLLESRYDVTPDHLGPRLKKENVRTLMLRTRSELNTEWDISKLGLPRLPFNQGAVKYPAAFVKPAIRQAGMFSHVQPRPDIKVAPSAIDAQLVSALGLYVEDIPIHMPGQGFRIPEVLWNNFGLIIEQLIGIEEDLNPLLKSFYIYLTIQQTPVYAHQSQRMGGIHVDGYQNMEKRPRREIQHQIAVTNMTPTTFFAHGFDVAKLSLGKKEFFAGLREQRDEDFSYRPNPFQIHVLNAYTPHETTPATADGYRTFIRMSASRFQFMGEDNHRNTLFDYDWGPEAQAAYKAQLLLEAKQKNPV